MNSTVASVKWSYVACSKLCFSRGQWKMIRGSCWLSLAAHPNRLHPRVPFWFFLKNDDYYALPCSSLKRYPHQHTRATLSRLQTTFWHCSLTLETTKKRLETRDYKKMRFRRAAAVTFFLGGDAEVLRAGVPHFFLRAARGYVFSLYFGLYHQYYLKSC